MDPKTIAELTDVNDKPDTFHNRVLTYVRGLVKMSRTRMSRYYRFWDLQDRVYRAEKVEDRDDAEQRLKQTPTKMVVPNTFAQVMTFVSFIFLMYRQNSRFFELKPTGGEDYDQKREDCELSLERDLNHNEFNTKLFQHLLDTARFGLGVLETSWSLEETRAFVVPPAQPQMFNGVQVGSDPLPGQWQQFTKFEGNRIRNVSPYRFFPDTRFPLVDFQKGDFCACEDDFSIAELRRLESQGEVAGIDFIRPLGDKWQQERGGEQRGTAAQDLLADTGTRRGFSSKNDSHTALVTKVQVKIVPSKFQIGDKDTDVLDPDINWPVLYNVWYANDNRVIKLEQVTNWHGEFSFCIAQFTPDMHHTMSLGLAELVYHMQDVISWLINSHIKSVRRVIANRLIVDPKLVETKTLDGDGDIYLRKSVTVPLDQAVGQLRSQDVTSNHMSDAGTVGQMMEAASGVNGNMQGQYSEGRRSAYQSRVVTAGAAGRMKLHAQLIWESCYSRIGRHMLSNQRQSLSFESFSRLIGTCQPTDDQLTRGIIDPQQVAMLRYQEFQGTPEEIICSDDFFIFDSTLTSEKGYMAQSLQELLAAVMQSNPMAAVQFSQSVDLTKIFDEINELRGGGPLSRFAYTPAQKAAMQAQAMQQQQLQMMQGGQQPQPGAAPSPVAAAA